jgi:Predicted signal transduction protein with a C-terminal ATPase domain
MKYINGITNFFKNLKIRERFLLSFVILIFVPTVMITFLSYNKSSEIIEKQVIVSTRQSFEQASKFILYKMDNIKDVSSILYMNKDLQNILGKDIRSYPLSEQIDDYNNLLDILRPAQFNSSEDIKIRVYVKNNSIYSNEGNTFINENSVKDTEWFKKVLENGIYWRPTYEYNYDGVQGRPEKIISCIRVINRDGLAGENIGAISIDVSEDSIYQIINETNITSQGDVYLADEDGNVISSRDKSIIGENISGQKYFEEVKNETEGYKKVKLDSDTSIVCYKKLENTDWQLIAVIPLHEIISPSRQILSYLILIMALVLVVSLTAAYYISGGITKRIRQLTKNMKKVEEENWDLYIPVDSLDEIGSLQKSFNRMIENMRLLIKEKYEAEINKKSAELKALQAQINPHFLYNTLDMINWMALKYKARDISYIVGNLAKFFKLSLSNGKDIVRIADEVNHVKIYLDIQNKRFADSIKCIFDISEDIENYSTVKLILQPIVENAIVHGIQEKENKEGIIKVSGNIENGIIKLTVEDNGMGMENEQIEELLYRPKSKGYGIKNVNERIKLYFGEQYGLEFSSTIGSGTTVTIRFPAVPFNKDEKILS